MATPQEVRRVDSFSQLPFIRPAAAAQQQQQQQGRDTIRLFGREFSNNDPLQQQQRKQEAGAGSPDAANGSTVTSEGNGGGGGAKGGAAAAGETRKFECHYCCRNFPTSQALGGHQNAHKRERQHAKRAHLQASLAMHRYVPGGHHMYGALLNYHHHHHPAAARYDHPPPHYPMWTTAGMGPYAGGPGSVSQPIDGSPVAQGHWRVPLPAVESFGAAVRHGHGAADMAPAVVVQPGAVMTSKDEKVVMSLLSSSPSLSSCSSTSPEKLGRCELGQQEALSLDLHL
ncbi:Zinc finger protein 6 [Hordeum vulgare]|uniref:Predicted protein n=1 Tax=Hordeum vulgare subsp. vulgare TaxID=112509 RepID=F2D2G2_HORVV|nr:zinc finger protein 8-like [Hordeum vulgare subsp. vulgare]KAE8814024.1 Zinc finger protein 6 [Hordeum vulgare]BAJ89283.1 predicted protein [Hordeum vulgare subsp. vulgare]